MVALNYFAVVVNCENTSNPERLWLLEMVFQNQTIDFGATRTDRTSPFCTGTYDHFCSLGGSNCAPPIVQE